MYIHVGHLWGKLLVKKKPPHGAYGLGYMMVQSSNREISLGKNWDMICWRYDLQYRIWV